MKLAVIGAALLALGVTAVVCGVLPPADALAIGDRVWPILLFVVAVTVVAEIAASAGVFDVAAFALAHIARGRTWLLWLLVVLLAVASTAFLSLDTTAVLLTPVVVAVARAHRLSPLPFVFATVWLANTASLVLPVSNLTNLLAAHRLGGGTPAFVALLGGAAAVATAVTIVLLWVVFHRSLRGRFTVAAPPRVADRVLLVCSAAVVVLLLPLLVSGIAPWIPTSIAALALVAVCARRSPAVLRSALVPWQVVVFAAGLFLVVGALSAAGSSAVLALVAGSGDDPVSLWRLSGVGMLAANAVNNLPAYLALEGVADSPTRLAAVLVGVNAGPLITPWASLATLLWHERLRALGVDVSWRRYVLLGVVAAPVIVALGVVPLVL